MCSGRFFSPFGWKMTRCRKLRPVLSLILKSEPGRDNVNTHDVTCGFSSRWVCNLNNIRATIHLECHNFNQMSGAKLYCIHTFRRTFTCWNSGPWIWHQFYTGTSIHTYFLELPVRLHLDYGRKLEETLKAWKKPSNPTQTMILNTNHRGERHQL